MREQPFYHNIDDLPGRFPIFPLAGALLLPRGHLPLNIFEPRYLAMVDDALGAERLIGMIQPCDPGDRSERPALYTTGCVGRITSFTETDDGRYLITLTGVCRFHVHQELDCLTPYRQIAGNFEIFKGDINPIDAHLDVGRDHLLSVLKIYLTLRELETDWEAVKQAPGETLVNSLAAICPFDPQEKQALLEAPTLDERAEILITLLEMSNASAGRDDESSIQ